MTATDELRRLLDERGVEYWATTSFIGATITSDGIERHYLVSTWWVSPLFGRVEATDMGDGGVLHMACLNGCDLTPEQAVEATLGPLTERAAKDSEKDSEKDSDGRGERRMDYLCDGYLYFRSYWCRECDERFAYRLIGHDDALPKYCPNCGGKVVGE